MISLLNSLLALIIIYTIKINLIFITFTLLIIFQTILYKPSITLIIKKLFYSIPLIAGIIILHSFFYYSGRIVIFIDFIKIYVEGFSTGIEISIRLFYSMLYIFSQNYINRKEEILFHLENKIINKVIIKRIMNILFLSLFFIELFFERYVKRENKKGIFYNIKNIFYEIENNYIINNKKKFFIINAIDRKKYPSCYKISNYIVLTFFALILIFHYIYY